jgi:hypothetical protein
MKKTGALPFSRSLREGGALAQIAVAECDNDSRKLTLTVDSRVLVARHYGLKP